MNKEELFKTEWYIQGLNAAPVSINVGPVSGLVYMKPRLGYSYTRFIMDFKKDYIELHYAKDDFKNMTKEFMKHFREDDDYLGKLNEYSDEDRVGMLEFVKKINFDEWSDEVLLKKYDEFFQLYSKAFGTSHLVEPVGITVDEMLQNKLKNEEDFNKIFTILTQPTRTSFISEFNDSLRKLVEKRNSEEYDSLLKIHLEKFSFIRNSWLSAKEYNKEMVKEEVNNIISGKDKIVESSDLSKNKEQKEKLLSKYDNEVRDLVKIIDFFTWWQDERKTVILTGMEYIERFAKEISKRTGMKVENLKYMLSDEELLDEVELSKRREKCAYVFLGKEREIFIENEYDEFMDRIKKEDHEEVGQINGICASIGKVVGNVKICITEEDIKNFPEGYILVTSMTRPEFVPAMKKAKAIVTDEGGITCHAAVISRELGVPCVIGTKIATKVLKDEQIVQVIAEHGLVKILQ